MTITEKRALLWKEYILACYGNHENYYYSTLSLGIPDGEEEHTVFQDIACGEYDDAITETDWDIIGVYTYAKSHYGKHGWYISDNLILTESKAIAKLKEIGYAFPDKIHKRNGYSGCIERWYSNT